MRRNLFNGPWYWDTDGAVSKSFQATERVKITFRMEAFNALNHTNFRRLSGATVCVTIEPCLMCVGALVHARIGRLVYGAAEPRTGAIVSTVTGGELPGLNHRFEVVAGVQEDRCRELVQAFFRGRR